MVEETGNREWTNTTDNWSDSGKVGAFANLWGEVAFQYAFFAGSAGIDKSGAGSNHRTRNQPWNARGSDDYIILVKLCQVIATVKEVDVVIGIGVHFVKRGTDELAATDNGNSLVFKINVVTGKEPVNGGSGGGVEIAVF